MQETGVSSSSFILKGLFFGLVCGVLAGFVLGLLEIRDQRYLEQGLTHLGALALCRKMNGVALTLLILFGVLSVTITLLRALTRSWAGAAVYCLAVVGSFVAFVLSTNLLFYHVVLEHVAKFLHNFQHTIAPERVAKLVDPVRGTFFGVYSLLLADFSAHWGKILVLCLVNVVLGLGAGWLLTRLLKRVWPRVLSEEAPRGWTNGRAARIFGWLSSGRAAAIALLLLLVSNGSFFAIEVGRGERLQDRPNVILISVDTLRADHLGCYGYERQTSPTIDHLAKTGVLFEEALASSPWTLPSHVSMVTSLSPATHGCSLVGGAKLQKSITTVAEILRDEGYRTHAITTILYLTKTYGFEQGFDNLTALGHEARAERVTNEAVEWLSGCGDQRFFLFLHYYDAHSDYLPPESYRERFDPGYKGPIDGSVANLLEIQDRMTDADLRHLVALYDGEIAYVDDQLKRLFDAIQDLGLWEKSVIVFVSDHGEEFREHGSFGHGFTLYDEQLLVPLVISRPGVFPEGRRVKEPVQVIDIVPTLAEMLDLKTRDGARKFEGMSLAEHCRGSETAGDLSRDAFSQTQLGEQELYADRVEGAKAIFDATSESWELYDLIEDPGETKNRVAQEGKRLSRIASKLEPYVAYARRVRAESRGEGETVELDEKSIETLKSLGYIQ